MQCPDRPQTALQQGPTGPKYDGRAQQPLNPPRGNRTYPSVCLRAIPAWAPSRRSATGCPGMRTRQSDVSCHVARCRLRRYRTAPEVPVPCRRWGNRQARPARSPDALDRRTRPRHPPTPPALTARAPSHTLDTRQDDHWRHPDTWDRCTCPTRHHWRPSANQSRWYLARCYLACRNIPIRPLQDRRLCRAAAGTSHDTWDNRKKRLPPHVRRKCPSPHQLACRKWDQSPWLICPPDSRILEEPSTDFQRIWKSCRRIVQSPVCLLHRL